MAYQFPTLVQDLAEPEIVLNSLPGMCRNELKPEQFSVLLTKATESYGGREPIRFALLIVNLQRTDRNRALAGMASAKNAWEIARERLSTALRPVDRFALLSHDEVGIFLPKITSESLIALAVNRIRLAFAAPIQATDQTGQAGQTHQTVNMHPVIGCAFFPDHESVLERLVAAADDSCRLARSTTVGYIVFRGAGRAQYSAALVDELRTAISKNELEVWFQPQIDLKQQRCIAAEALIRWFRPKDKEAINPAQLVEIAEKNGLMVDLTMFVLHRALRQMTEFDSMGIAISIAVNLSPSILARHDLTDMVRNALSTWKIPAERLILEVTESSIMVDFEGALANMQLLKRLGVSLSIDDFGTGYSSLAYLSRMPLHELKIDQVFVRDMQDNSNNRKIIRSVIALAHTFGLKAVAEGVEDKISLDLLNSYGCDVIQGYYFSKPIPGSAWENWWRDYKRLL